LGRLAAGGGHCTLVGTPEQIADHIPTVCLDISSLMASSYGYNRDEIEPLVAQ
jgi:alkanesulfonate monooxygenase SsuD/methylene tetrahydromethanopterin reductase-like flavin-dependent oxidoreductase (luciferase family)